MARYKGYIDTDVLTEARKRIHHIFDVFDSVVVMFSGGKEVFAREMALAGIKEVFVERRVPSPKAVNALRSIAEEVELLSGCFREVRRRGAVSYLVPLKP